MKKAMVLGPSLASEGTGLGWLKHNICEALKKKGVTTYSIYATSDPKVQTLKMESIISVEGRSEAVMEIEEVAISSLSPDRHWDEIKALLKPDIVIVVGDPEKVWFVIEEEKDPKVKLVYYYLSEAHTANRWIPIAGKRESEERLDLKTLMEEFDVVIPATNITKIALTKDMGIAEEKLCEILHLPVWKWSTHSDLAVQYRRSIQADPTCKIYYSIAANTIRKRLDQLLMYFKFHLLRKPCDKLVLHTNIEGAYDLIAIAGRLGIVRNLRIVQQRSKAVMAGVMSAGNVFISTPAAEGFGLPLWESLLIAKPVIHTTVGHPGDMLPNVKGREITLLKADIPYFPPVGNQVWYAIPQNPKESTVYSRKYDVEDVVETPESFQDKFVIILEKSGCL